MVDKSDFTPSGATYLQQLQLSKLQAIGIMLLALVIVLALIVPRILPINSVLLSVALMLAMCLVRIPVVIALMASSIVAALHSGMDIAKTMATIESGFSGQVSTGIVYVMIGALAVALARSGLLELLAQKISAISERNLHHQKMKWALYFLLAIAAILSQNLIPVHIAFIPIMIPPLLKVFNALQIDRRAVACILACMISTSYLLLPFGFGSIYLFDILLVEVQKNAIPFNQQQVVWVMFFPVMGIVAGMLFAVFISYRKKRVYQDVRHAFSVHSDTVSVPSLKIGQLLMVVLSIGITVWCQIQFGSLLLGAMLGFLVLSFSGIFAWKEQDDIFTQGLRMMVQVAVIITVASSFSEVLKETKQIEPLINSASVIMGDNKALSACILLLIGLFVTIGFGDSFASVPILAPIYIPLAGILGFGPEAIVMLLGAAAALGDAGSPASTISLGATAGLNADGQHDHMKDTVIPTFMHANLGMVLFATIAAIYLT